MTSRSKSTWYRVLQRAHIPADVLNLTEETTLAELQRYRVLVYPHPAILGYAGTYDLEWFLGGCESSGATLFVFT